jgi:NAD(P)-dependent dehydrogenase (short-subunit alcohol dehydrogenase family)
MTSTLQGKVAIVTGGGAGIGGGIARRLAEDGASVLVADLSAESAKANAATINRESGWGPAEAMVVDVARPSDIEAMVGQAVALWGRLDIVVNNAYPTGGHPDLQLWGEATEIEEEAWDLGFDIGLKAHYLAAKHAVPEMERHGGGSIINISSVHGLLAAPKAMIYETVKCVRIADDNWPLLPWLPTAECCCCGCADCWLCVPEPA